jgi:hypothetical protein
LSAGRFVTIASSVYASSGTGEPKIAVFSES